MKKLAFMILSISALFPASLAAAQCAGGSNAMVGAIPVVTLSDRVFFRTSSLELDYDGSPLAYGVSDQGHEDICNGLAPKAGVCRGSFRGACYQVCQQTFAAWSQGSRDPTTLSRTMCSVGLGGSGCSVPDVRLQPPPRQAFFVSETSLKTSRPDGPNDRTWLRSQAAQLDPDHVPYLVVPAALRAIGVRFGDVGIAYNAASLHPTPIPFIVGDGGGLGEGSVSLLALLEPARPPQLSQAVSALGEHVMRYKHGIVDDFRFVVFRNTASLVPRSANVTLLHAAQLPSWIASTARSAFQSRSSMTEMQTCTSLPHGTQ